MSNYFLHNLILKHNIEDGYVPVEKNIIIDYLRKNLPNLKILTDDQLMNHYRDYNLLYLPCEILDINRLDLEHFNNWVTKSLLQLELEK